MDENKISKEDVQNLMDELDEAGDLEDTEKYALKQLLNANEKDIAFKTDLHEGQINAISKILTIHHIIQAQSVYIKEPEKGRQMMSRIAPMLTENIMRLLVSRKRSGRREFVDAFKGSVRNIKDNADFNKFVGGM